MQGVKIGESFRLKSCSRFVERLIEGIRTIATAFAEHPVIIRLSDFKSNEYAHLLGGSAYEPEEENPMIGFRGASRYGSAEFEAAFALECEAIRRLRDEMGFTNIQVMVPFVRTVAEIERVIEVLAAHGLERGVNGGGRRLTCRFGRGASFRAAARNDCPGAKRLGPRYETAPLRRRAGRPERRALLRRPGHPR